MARVVLFGLLLVSMALAAPADKSPAGEKSVKAGKADTAGQAAKVAQPDKAKDKIAPAVKADKADKPGKAASAEKAVPADKSDPESAYEALLQERARLEREKRVLEWEEGLAAASMQDTAAYLVVDLDRRMITAKLGGVPMRHAPIMWRYERPGQTAVGGIFQVAERQVEAPPSAQPLPQLVVAETDSAKTDSAKTDTSMMRLAAIHHGGSAPRYYDPQRRFCISLQGGPDLWLATLPPTQTWMDSLEVRVHLWIRDFPAVVQHRQSIHLFLAPADNYWIYAMAVLGARVLVIPPS